MATPPAVEGGCEGGGWARRVYGAERRPRGSARVVHTPGVVIVLVRRGCGGRSNAAATLTALARDTHLLGAAASPCGRCRVGDLHTRVRREVCTASTRANVEALTLAMQR